MSWPRVQVRRVARLGTGHTPSRQHPEYWENCTIPWLTLADVWQLRDGTKQVVTETAESISELGLANSAAVLHPAGTVALSRTASVGFSGILGADMATSQDFATWTCGPELHPEFLLWALRGTIDQIRATTMGSTHKTIYMPDIEQIEIPLPPLETQKALASFLDDETARIDALIEKKRRLASVLEERFAATLVRKLDGLPKRRLKTLATKIGSGKTPLGGAETYVSEGVLFIRSQNVWMGRVDLSDVAFIKKEVDAQMRTTRVLAGDVLLNITGASLGRCATTPLDLPAANVNQHVCIIRPSPEVSGRLLELAIRSKAVQDQIRGDQVGGNRDGLTFEQVGNLTVSVPATAAAQARLTTDLEQVETRHQVIAERLRLQMKLLEEHRQALIAGVVSGWLETGEVAA